MLTLDSQQVARTIVCALERMAFVLAEPLREPVAVPPANAWHARVRWRQSDGAGQVILSAESGFLSELAASMLGIEPDDVHVPEVGVQALLELGNVVGGQVVVLLGGREREFWLGLPEKTVPPHDGDLVVDLRSDGGRLRVTLIDG